MPSPPISTSETASSPVSVPYLPGTRIERSWWGPPAEFVNVVDMKGTTFRVPMHFRELFYNSKDSTLSDKSFPLTALTPELHLCIADQLLQAGTFESYSALRNLAQTDRYFHNLLTMHVAQAAVAADYTQIKEQFCDVLQYYLYEHSCVLNRAVSNVDPLASKHAKEMVSTCEKMMESMMKNGISPTTVNPTHIVEASLPGMSALHFAATGANTNLDTNVLNLLLQYTRPEEIDVKDAGGSTALSRAAQEGCRPAGERPSRKLYRQGILRP